MDAIENENAWSQETMKLLVTLNSGSIVALLAMSQALVSNGHFHEIKAFLLTSLGVFLVGIYCGVLGFRARARAWSATIATPTDSSKKLITSSLIDSQAATDLSLLSFMTGAIIIGIGVALTL